MDSSAPPRLNSILERVKPLIPTIDDDSSSSGDEEIVSIYQRPAGLSLDVFEDFGHFLADDAEIETLLKPAAPAHRPEETGSQSLKLDDDDDDEIVGNCSAVQHGTQHCDEDDAEEGAWQCLELNRGSNPNVNGTESDAGFPVLSFERLAQWDLDSVLQNMKENDLPRCHHVQVESVKTYAGGDKSRSQNIMERLFTFCKGQSSKSVPVERSNLNKQEAMWSKPLERMTAEIQLSHQECPTVHIDLRCPDLSIKPPRTSANLSSDPRSPAKYSTRREAPAATITDPKGHPGSRLGDREVSGKTGLLQKIREMNRNGNKYHDKCRDSPDSEVGNEAGEVECKPCQPGKSTCRDESHVSVEEHRVLIRSEPRGPQMAKPATVQQRSNNNPKQHSDQQRQQRKQTSQREQDQQILKQRKTHLPAQSVDLGNRASHLQSVNTLPGDVERKGCMLLIVKLSSPGMVGGRGGEKRLPAATKSHIYNTLVAWFLSSVGPDAPCDGAEGGVKVPFWVAGLQQLWTEDGLALHVLAVTRHSFTQRKMDPDVHALFYNHICRFLSETSLTQICPWLPELQILLDRQAYAPAIYLPSSCLSCFISASADTKVIDRAFDLGAGFNWQTVETLEKAFQSTDATQDRHTEVSVALGHGGFFLHPLITHYALQLVVDSGLDVCGLRLLYRVHRSPSDSAGGVPVNQKEDETCQPVLALAVRGPSAHSLLRGLTRSLDPLLTKKEDPHSKGQEPSLFLSPSLARQVNGELCLWFSGSFQRGSRQNLNPPLKKSVGGCRSPAFLCATTKADILLVVSPVVPPCCYGQVLAVCDRRGFSLKGLQRLPLHCNRAAVLGLTNQQANVFCIPPTVTRGQVELEFPPRCLVLILRKENAMHHSVGLPAALMREFKAQKLHFRRNSVHTLEPNFCFHTVPYSSKLFHVFVKRMWTVPDPSGVILSNQKCLHRGEMERMVILALCGENSSQGLSLLHRVLIEGSEGDEQGARFKLRGLKWLPALTRLQAQELSPYELGEQLSHSSRNNLMDSPALLCALTRMDAFAALRKLLPHNYPGNLSILMSQTPEVASRQASLFFFDHEMIAGDKCGEEAALLRLAKCSRSRNPACAQIL